MFRLLQFFEGSAKKAVAGFEGTPGGVKKIWPASYDIKACVDALIQGRNISNSDREGLREFADCSRTLYVTERNKRPVRNEPLQPGKNIQ